MRRFFELCGSIGGLGYFVFQVVARLSNGLGVLGLPGEVRDAIMLLASAPLWASFAALLIGVICASYLVIDSGHHTAMFKWLGKRGWRVGPEYLIIGGLGGVVIFAAVALVGTIWWLQSPKAATFAPEKPPVAAVAPAPEPKAAADPLPKGVNFIRDGRQYLVLKHPYFKDDADKMNAQLSALEDLFGGEMADLYRDIDSFIRGWPATASHDKMTAITNLINMRQRMRDGANKYMEILSRRPSLRSELQDIIQDNGAFGALNGALNDYIDTMQVLPENVDQDKVRRILGNEQEKLKKASGELLKFVQTFTTGRVPSARRELETFI